jgi:hypothetical protein
MGRCPEGAEGSDFNGAVYDHLRQRKTLPPPHLNGEGGNYAAFASVTPFSLKSCSSSPVSNISRTMSQPPMNSPFT